MVATLATVTAVFIFANPVGAQTADTQYVLDNLWVFMAGVLVFFMQAGFALVEAGMTRAKNVSNIMAKNIADAGVGILAFWAVGFAFAYGGDHWLIGTSRFFLSGESLFGLTQGLSPATEFFFQSVFAATAVTIASGAMAERTKFSSYIAFSLFMTAVIYPVAVHWTWGGGLVSRINIMGATYSDFAGSSVVHGVGGMAALVGAWKLGPRIGRYNDDGSVNEIPGHSMALAVLGVFILWFGWFGFNPGSELAADDFVVFVALNTLLAACAGMVAATALNWFRTGVPSIAMAANGTLAGLVAITAGAGTVNTFGAVSIGFLAGLLVVLAIAFFDRIRIDDPVSAISVHGVSGAWGTLAIGLFARYDDAFLGRANAGLFYGGGVAQLIVQALVVLILFSFAAVASYIVFSAIDRLMGLRVPAEDEIIGLDITEHGGPGYSLDQTVLGLGAPATTVGTTISLETHESHETITVT
ncbi:MAG TPA: ammonium transporter [Acidimicrobiales bacterium]|nr:ammonium transporter [Acidimicrobiales bacterium]